VLKNTNWNIFEKQKLYKAEIIVNMADANDKRNLVIEDYLAWSFRVINNKFKTESVAVTNSSRSWRWNHLEYNPDVVMINYPHIWWDSVIFEYYFRPEFTWTYTHPPATAYLMYQPQTRASTWFNIITVK
jgi:uncharacterized protein YfaS (alpha-2-macroglobulin family)